MSFNNSVIFNKRAGTSEDPYVPISESHKVVNGKVQLTEVPSEFQKVDITSSGTWVETDEEINDATQYHVDYLTGIITFDSSLDGQTLGFSYQGTGVILIPISRIYTKESNGEVVESLDEKITTIDNSLKDLYDWSGYARLQGNYAKAEGDNAKSESERAKDLTDDYEEIVYDSSLLWQQYVDTYNDISTTFSNPKNGWTTLVQDTLIVYRYYELDGEWKPIQKMQQGSDVFVDELPPSNTGNMWIDLSE